MVLQFPRATLLLKTFFVRWFLFVWIAVSVKMCIDSSSRVTSIWDWLQTSPKWLCDGRSNSHHPLTRDKRQLLDPLVEFLQRLWLRVECGTAPPESLEITNTTKISDKPQGFCDFTHALCSREIKTIVEQSWFVQFMKHSTVPTKEQLIGFEGRTVPI